MEKKSVVLYKNQAALVEDREGDKYLVKYLVSPATATGKKAVYGEQKVREKDVILLNSSVCSSLDAVLSSNPENFKDSITEAWELLTSDESTAKEAISFSDLCDLACGGLKADDSFAFYKALADGLLFSLNQNEIKNGNLLFTPRSQEEIDLINQKNYEKEHEAEIRQAFIARLKQKKLNLPEDAKFMGEVEAFALCKTDKSKVMQEAGFSQTIEKAHKLLIDTGIWDYTKNPHPSRFGFSFSSASDQLGPMPDEERVEVPGIAYAIDSEHSNDPDDAVAFDGSYLWVHIADPASSVTPDSKIDLAARGRGTTLYIPEGASRMLCESCLEDYALGLKEDSRALSFRLKLSDDCQVEECAVLKTKITVHRMTYKEAEEKKESSELKPLFEIARKNKARREANHAVTIQMPEVSISVDKETKKVTIEADEKYERNGMIAELMILAGEGAAKFAFKNQIPFPFVSQEAPEFPDKIPEGLAGDFAKIKCMRKRSVGITPAPHAGLGLSFYSQVTSPLRRYGDLIAHQQLRAFIDGRRLMPKDEMLEKVAAGDAASIAAKKASRKSDTHWKLVYLLQNPEMTFEGVCIDIRGSEALFLIPSIDMQTTIKGITDVKLNDVRTLKMKKADIPELTADFDIV
ncbi:MAG: RNB domain-containing ribonuclease [Treponema sp.]|nr:RNB domain-containing ribonuclease [Treponema sp.]